MKKCITALVLAVSAIGANAQDIFDNPDNHAYFGVRASYELACPTDVERPGSNIKYGQFGNGSGFNVGVIYQLPMYKNLYFEPGANIYYNTYSVSNAGQEELGNFVGLPLKDASVRKWGVRIPLILGYHFDFISDLRISVFTGPELALGFGGKIHLDMDKMDGSISAFGDDGNFNRCDVKWRFGVGATYKHHYYAAISGAAGICDMYKNEPSMRTNLFNITLGYNF